MVTTDCETDGSFYSTNEDEMAVDEEPVEEVNLEDDEELQEAVSRT